ncbi:MAG TPA: SDR family NAD(P)-dependent oxidoreductase [Flavitalea sp.]|nr:SDR family NAD(P)-dependent oxidoreductase [Flavitalea sp.]
MPSTILITGANGNLGTEVVKKILEAGFRVIAIDGKDDHLQFASGNPAYRFHSIDLTDENAVDSILGKLLEQENISAGFLLAGGFAMGKIGETNATEMRRMIDLNFFTAYSIARQLYGSMQSKGYGRLVFIGARPPLEPMAGHKMSAYAISKSMIFRLAEHINAESKDVDITATVIVPATIDTPANRTSMPNADYSKWVTPAQIAALLLVIVSETGAPLRETILKM